MKSKDCKKVKARDLVCLWPKGKSQSRSYSKDHHDGNALFWELLLRYRGWSAEDKARLMQEFLVEGLYEESQERMLQRWKNYELYEDYSHIQRAAGKAICEKCGQTLDRHLHDDLGMSWRLRERFHFDEGIVDPLITSGLIRLDRIPTVVEDCLGRKWKL